MGAGGEKGRDDFRGLWKTRRQRGLEPTELKRERDRLHFIGFSRQGGGEHGHSKTSAVGEDLKSSP